MNNLWPFSLICIILLDICIVTESLNAKSVFRTVSFIILNFIVYIFVYPFIHSVFFKIVLHDPYQIHFVLCIG